MALYEARFIDHRDEVYSAHAFEADHDEAAKSFANRLLRSPFGKGHEVWHGDRLVHREIYQP